jgi:hypothetical protein
VQAPQHPVAVRVGCERFLVAARGIENVTEESQRVRALRGRQMGAAEQLAQPRLRARELAFALLDGGQSHHGIRQARHDREGILGQEACLAVRAPPAVDVGETREGHRLPRIEGERTLIT